MPSILSLLRSAGASGATANARAELEVSHRRVVDAAVVARRVHRRLPASRA